MFIHRFFTVCNSFGAKILKKVSYIKPANKKSGRKWTPDFAIMHYIRRLRLQPFAEKVD